MLSILHLAICLQHNSIEQRIQLSFSICWMKPVRALNSMCTVWEISFFIPFNSSIFLCLWRFSLYIFTIRFDFIHFDFNSNKSNDVTLGDKTVEMFSACHFHVKKYNIKSYWIVDTHTHRDSVYIAMHRSVVCSIACTSATVVRSPVSASRPMHMAELQRTIWFVFNSSAQQSNK